MEDKKFCQFCGEKIDKDLAICPKCGRQIEEINNENSFKEKIKPEQSIKFYEEKWFMWLTLVFFSPIGIFLMWKYHSELKNGTKIILTVVFSLLFLIVLATNTSDDSNDNESINNNNSITKSVETSKVTMADFSNMDKNSAQTWCNNNKINCLFQEENSNSISSGKFISQSVSANTEVSEESNVTITYSKGKKPIESKKQYKDKCKKIKYKNLARNPQKYEGQFVKFKGEVIQVSEGWLNNVTLRVNVTKGEYDIWQDTILVNYEYASENENKILEDDIIKIYGQFKGTTSYESILGQKITIPEVDAKYISIKK